MCLVNYCNEILKSYNVSHTVFDRSIEYYNDSEILIAIQRLSLNESRKESSLSKTQILQVVDFYNKTFDVMMDNTDPGQFDSQTFICQIEDRTFVEFGIELNDLVHHYLSSEDCDVKSRISDLRQSFSSVQKLNQNVFE